VCEPARPACTKGLFTRSDEVVGAGSPTGVALTWNQRRGARYRGEVPDGNRAESTRRSSRERKCRVAPESDLDSANGWLPSG